MIRKAFLGFLGIVFIVLVVIFGVRLFSGEDNRNGQQLPAQKDLTETAIANPASKNCEDKGGKIVFLNETSGQLGICQFTDGSECEEWQFYRGECKKGKFTSADTSHAYSGVITKINGRFSFKDSLGITYTLEIPANVSLELQERLSAEAFSAGIVTLVAAETPPLSKNLILKSFQEK